MKRIWNVVPVFQIVQKIPKNCNPYFYLSIGLEWWLKELWFKRYSKMHPVLCTNTHHDVTDLVNQGVVNILRLYKLNILRTEHNFSTKWKMYYPVPQMTDFEKLSFCRGGNLNIFEYHKWGTIPLEYYEKDNYLYLFLCLLDLVLDKVCLSIYFRIAGSIIA